MQDIIDKINADLKMRPMLEVDKKQVPDYYNGMNTDALIRGGQVSDCPVQHFGYRIFSVKPSLESPDDYDPDIPRKSRRLMTCHAPALPIQA